MDEYIVYIKINDDNIITNINSSAFLSDTTGWVQIDEGIGDKYHHAQNNYLELPIMDGNGIYNYKYQNNQVILRTEEDKNPEYTKIHAANEIVNLKQKLAETDYIAAKIGEGAATREEYAEKLAQRAEWRTKINELEDIINN